jgi:opacity protein-like surface antigen
MSKKLLMLFALLACTLTAAAVNAQERTRLGEFSIAGSAQAYVFADETLHFISLPIRVGGFVTRNVLIEAEAILTGWDEEVYKEVYGRVYDEAEFGYIVSLNGSYNIIATEKLMPFLLLGIGFSNGIPLANAAAFASPDGPRPTVLNAGAGVKFLFSPMAALRVEYRLQDFSGEKIRGTWYGRTYIDKIDVTLHSVFFGISLFF